MQYEIYDKGGLMKKKRQNLELWMGELRDKVRKDGTISNKDIMLFFTEKNLGQDDLSAVYELLHESNIDINFDEDASDEDLEILEDEETDELCQCQEHRFCCSCRRVGDRGRQDYTERHGYRKSAVSHGGRNDRFYYAEIKAKYIKP